MTIELLKNSPKSAKDQVIGMIGPFPIDTVQGIDCIEGMKKLPDNSVDVAIADPPYNASKGNIWKWDNSVNLPGLGGNWSKVMADWDNMPLSDYFAFTAAWITELKRVVRPTGSIWIHGTYHNIGLINFVLQILEVEIINEVIWYKRNSFPNLSGRRLTASHETILWAHTGEKKREYFFNYEASKEMKCPEDGLKEPGKQMRTVWDIPNNKEREELYCGKHPTQKPLRLLKRMLKLSSKEGQILLVPFAGSGSECIAAKELSLNFIGFETDPEYMKVCKSRLKHASLSLKQVSLTFPSKSDGLEEENPSDNGRDNRPSKPRSAKTIPSLIKWTGSKRSQATAIATLMPSYRRYFEPFLGGGALLYLAAVPGSVAGDIYEPLIKFWRLVQDSPRLIIENYQKQWEALQKNLPDYYYKVRDRFNEDPNPLDLCFLTRTCVNGIVRFNDKGEFNNSFHLSRKGMTPRQFEQIVETWHRVIQGVRFVCQNYSKTIDEAGQGDFVYFDPPYAGNKQRYTENLDVEKLFDVMENLNKRGVKWGFSFDGRRGTKDLTHPVPQKLYKRRLFLTSGNSPIGKVLNGSVERVEELLYLNY